MDNTNNKISASFNSKPAWITLWVLALAGMLLSLRSLALIKPKTCIVMCIVSFVLSAAGTLMGIAAAKTKLEVGEKFICCKTLFGGEKYMPVDAVTGIKACAFGTVCIYSPSFKIRCFFVKNREQIVSAVKEKIKNKE